MSEAVVYAVNRHKRVNSSKKICIQSGINSKEYFSQMRLASSLVSRDICFFLEGYVEETNSCFRLINHFLTTRGSKKVPKLRPYLTLVVAGQKDFKQSRKDLITISALTEVANICEYLENLAFDKKGRCKYESDIKYILSSNILSSLIHERICTLKSSETSINILQKVFSYSHRAVQEGQSIDLLDIPRLGSDELEDLGMREYLDKYIKRCINLGIGSLGYIYRIGSLFQGLTSKDGFKFELIGLYHSFTLQVINDMADFVEIGKAALTVGKDKTDTFADLRNERLTLPIYIAYQFGDDLDKTFIKKWSKCKIQDKYERVISIFKKTKAFDYCYTLAGLSTELAYLHLMSTDMDENTKNSIMAALFVGRSNSKYKYINNKYGIPLKKVIDNRHEGGEQFYRVSLELLKSHSIAT